MEELLIRQAGQMAYVSIAKASHSIPEVFSQGFQFCHYSFSRINSDCHSIFNGMSVWLSVVALIFTYLKESDWLLKNFNKNQKMTEKATIESKTKGTM